MRALLQSPSFGRWWNWWLPAWAARVLRVERTERRSNPTPAA